MVPSGLWNTGPGPMAQPLKLQLFASLQGFGQGPLTPADVASATPPLWPLEAKDFTLAPAMADLSLPPGLEPAHTVAEEEARKPEAAAPAPPPLAAAERASVLSCAVPDLVRCCERGDAATALELLRSGQDPSLQDDFGLSALHGAAKKGHEEVARLLISWRADVNVRQSRGETPLHYACKYGRAPVVRLLLDHGAEATSESNEGRTPADYALEKNHGDIVQLIRAHTLR